MYCMQDIVNALKHIQPKPHMSSLYNHKENESLGYASYKADSKF